MSKFSFTLISHNAKTGPIPVTMTDKQSCPNSCPLKGNGCYASAGRLNIHWMKLGKSYGLSIKQLADKISGLPAGKLWRHNQAGDLPGSNEKINRADLKLIVKANKGKRGFTYTHYKPVGSNKVAIREANKAGFTINLSADNLTEADKFMALGIAPVATILPLDQKENVTTPAGNKVVVCPNYTHNVQCVDCQLCQKADRSVIVGFPAHGIAKRAVTETFNSK